MVEEKFKNCFLSSLRRGMGLRRSSSEKVRAAELPWGGWGLLRLKIDGFLIPNRPKMDFCVPGVVTMACGTPVCIAALLAAPATCSCSLSDM